MLRTPQFFQDSDDRGCTVRPFAVVGLCRVGFLTTGEGERLIADCFGVVVRDPHRRLANPVPLSSCDVVVASSRASF